MNKNDTVGIRISDIGQDGEGIGKIAEGPEAGYTVFVKDTVPGDTVKVKIIKAKKRYGYGKLLEVIEPSQHRRKPACPIAERCGGCQLQTMDDEEQIRMKTQKVRNDLLRIGGFENPDELMLPTVACEQTLRYRNKAQFPIGRDKEGNPIAGFYAGRTHSIIPCDDCLLGARENQQILDTILDWMKEYKVPAYQETDGSGLVRHVLIRKGEATGEIIMCIIVTSARIPAKEKLVEALRKVDGLVGITYSINDKQTNIIMNGPVRTLWGRSYMEDILASKEDDIAVRFRISPASFYQVNHAQTEKIYRRVLELAALTGKETVMDLYCGIGTISLFLAAKARKVIGVEIVPQAIVDAKANAELNGMTNAEFYTGKAEEVVPRLYEEQNVHADVVVVDPPRKGCDPVLLDTMVDMSPERIVYVSCDPATLARDLKVLSERGYKVEHVQPFDQFPQTVHVETVVLMTKVQK